MAEISRGYIEALVKRYGDDERADFYILVNIIARICTNGDASAAEALLMNWRKRA